MQGSAVILLSGGMDSGVMLAWAKKQYGDIHALNFNYGSKHARQEIAMAKALAGHYGCRLTTVDLPFINTLFQSSLLQSGEDIPEGSYAEVNMLSTVVPFRNGIMLSIAVGYAENLKIDTVLIAAHSGDHPVYPDCRTEFVQAISDAATYGTYAQTKVLAPFGKMSKVEIAKLGRELNFDFTLTWSCYKGGDTHCGRCATCLERKAALGFDQGNDPTRYLA